VSVWWYLSGGAVRSADERVKDARPVCPRTKNDQSQRYRDRKYPRRWSQQARQLTPRRGISRASRESGFCVHTFACGISSPAVCLVPKSAGNPSLAISISITINRQSINQRSSQSHTRARRSHIPAQHREQQTLHLASLVGFIILWDTVGGTAHTTGHAREYHRGGIGAE